MSTLHTAFLKLISLLDELSIEEKIVIADLVRDSFQDVPSAFCTDNAVDIPCHTSSLWTDTQMDNPGSKEAPHTGTNPATCPDKLHLPVASLPPVFPRKKAWLFVSKAFSETSLFRQTTMSCSQTAVPVPNCRHSLVSIRKARKQLMS